MIKIITADFFQKKNGNINPNEVATWHFDLDACTTLSHTGTYTEACSVARKSYRIHKKASFGEIILIGKTLKVN